MKCSLIGLLIVNSILAITRFFTSLRCIAISAARFRDFVVFEFVLAMSAVTLIAYILTTVSTLGGDFADGAIYFGAEDTLRDKVRVRISCLEEFTWVFITTKYHLFHIKKHFTGGAIKSFRFTAVLNISTLLH